MKTVPTLLTTSTEEFIEQIELFQKYFDRIQLDIADGNLVPNVTTQISEIYDLLLHKEIHIKEETVFDFHLMVQNFSPELEQIVKIQELNVRVNIVLINAEHKINIGYLNNTYTFSIGLDIFPNTHIDNIARHYDLDLIPAIQIMTVNPGFQGSPFLPQMLQKIQQLRVQNYKGEILIDGGVNNMTIPTINSQQYLPDIICIGSYLTKSEEDLESRVNLLKKLE